MVSLSVSIDLQTTEILGDLYIYVTQFSNSNILYSLINRNRTT